MINSPLGKEFKVNLYFIEEKNILGVPKRSMHLTIKKNRIKLLDNIFIIFTCTWPETVGDYHIDDIKSTIFFG